MTSRGTTNRLMEFAGTTLSKLAAIVEEMTEAKGDTAAVSVVGIHLITAAVPCAATSTTDVLSFSVITDDTPEVSGA